MTIVDTLFLFQVLWTQTLSPHFKLFICVAILEKEKYEMMSKKFDFNDILKVELCFVVGFSWTTGFFSISHRGSDFHSLIRSVI